MTSNPPFTRGPLPHLSSLAARQPPSPSLSRAPWAITCDNTIAARAAAQHHIGFTTQRCCHPLPTPCLGHNNTNPPSSPTPHSEPRVRIVHPLHNKYPHVGSPPPAPIQRRNPGRRPLHHVVVISGHRVLDRVFLWLARPRILCRGVRGLCRR